MFDNNSTDATAIIAKEAGAEIRFVAERGKGNVVRRMFADVEADVYVLVDGDGTYDPASAVPMIERLLADRLDVMVGTRVSVEDQAYRLGHATGNRLLTGFAAWIFGRATGDMLSGYRVFSRRYVKSFPAFSSGFEIETELTVHALQLRMPVGEMTTKYFARVGGGESKLNTYRDGSRILMTILRLLKSERPFVFFRNGIRRLYAIRLRYGASRATHIPADWACPLGFQPRCCAPPLRCSVPSCLPAASSSIPSPWVARN